MSDLNPADFASLHMKPIQPDTLVGAVDNSIRRIRTRTADV